MSSKESVTKKNSRIERALKGMADLMAVLEQDAWHPIEGEVDVQLAEEDWVTKKRGLYLYINQDESDEHILYAPLEQAIGALMEDLSEENNGYEDRAEFIASGLAAAAEKIRAAVEVSRARQVEWNKKNSWRDAP